MLEEQGVVNVLEGEQRIVGGSRSTCGHIGRSLKRHSKQLAVHFGQYLDFLCEISEGADENVARDCKIDAPGEVMATGEGRTYEIQTRRVDIL
jgi:hypothetical protein